MGSLFKKKRRDGTVLPIFQMKYRQWDPLKKEWSGWIYRTTGTVFEREARVILAEIEKKEERKSLGIEPAVFTGVRLADAVTQFLEETHAVDRKVPEKNMEIMHPVLGTQVVGTPWWTRTTDFAREMLWHFGRDSNVEALAPRKAIGEFHKWLVREGGRRHEGVGSSTCSKTLKWYRRFCRWCVLQGYLEC